MGYVDYFLIVWDFINYAKSNDIMSDREEDQRREVSYPTA